MFEKLHLWSESRISACNATWLKAEILCLLLIIVYTNKMNACVWITNWHKSVITKYPLITQLKCHNLWTGLLVKGDEWKADLSSPELHSSLLWHLLLLIKSVAECEQSPSSFHYCTCGSWSSITDQVCPLCSNGDFDFEEVLPTKR